MSGGSGLVGRALAPLLLARGHKVNNLTTRKEWNGTMRDGVFHIYWNPGKRTLDQSVIADSDVVINLAGYSVANRWTQRNKDRMVASRLDSTDILVRLILSSAAPPSQFITASAAGYYKSSVDLQDETAGPGDGFLADLTRHWEDASAPLEKTATRRIIMRFGVVLDARDGALPRMLPLFRAGLGAAVGSGTQWMSWIHVKDLVRAIDHLIHTSETRGVYNLVSPEPIQNIGFSRTLASVLRRKLFLPPVPAFMLRFLYGEMATMVLASQRLHAAKLEASGFHFHFQDLRSALTDLLPHRV
jgi:uncharacterized protein (TIGR01777 family)